MLLRRPEYHFGQSDDVKDVVIGAADGLTVPFAIAAGARTAQSERDRFEWEHRRKRREIDEIPGEDRCEVAEIFRSCGVLGDELDRVVGSLSAAPLHAGFQTMVVGGVAAAFAVARLVS